MKQQKKEEEDEEHLVIGARLKAIILIFRWDRTERKLKMESNRVCVEFFTASDTSTRHFFYAAMTSLATYRWNIRLELDRNPDKIKCKYLRYEQRQGQALGNF